MMTSEQKQNLVWDSPNVDSVITHKNCRKKSELKTFYPATRHVIPQSDKSITYYIKTFLKTEFRLVRFKTDYQSTFKSIFSKGLSEFFSSITLAYREKRHKRTPFAETGEVAHTLLCTGCPPPLSPYKTYLTDKSNHWAGPETHTLVVSLDWATTRSITADHNRPFF